MLIEAREDVKLLLSFNSLLLIAIVLNPRKHSRYRISLVTSRRVYVLIAGAQPHALRRETVPVF